MIWLGLGAWALISLAAVTIRADSQTQPPPDAQRFCAMLYDKAVTQTKPAVSKDEWIGNCLDSPRNMGASSDDDQGQSL